MNRTRIQVAYALTSVMVVLLGVQALAQDGPYESNLDSGHHYGDGRKQVIHALRLEPRDAPRPAVVFFHGGGLIMGSPMQDLEWAKGVAGNGYVTFLAGYRLFDLNSGEYPWPAQLEDAQAAIRWVRTNAEEFNVDPDRICSIGHSSGGHLASLVGLTDAVVDGVSSRVDCVIDISGDADLTVPYPNPLWTEAFEGMFGGTLDEVPEIWQSASPAWNVDEEAPPFLIVHGTRDEEVPVEMARNLVDALAAAEQEFVYVEVPAGHMDIGDPVLTGAMHDAFLEAMLRPEE